MNQQIQKLEKIIEKLENRIEKLEKTEERRQRNLQDLLQKQIESVEERKKMYSTFR